MATDRHHHAGVGRALGVANACVDFITGPVVGAEIRAADVRPDPVERHEERELVLLVEAALVQVPLEVDALEGVDAVEPGAPHAEPPVDQGAETVVVKSDFGSSVSLKTFVSQPRFLSSTLG